MTEIMPKNKKTDMGTLPMSQLVTIWLCKRHNFSWDDMSATSPKLMTKGKFALCLIAVIIGAALQPIREYRSTGTVSGLTAAIAAVVFCMGLAIVLTIGWWANRPEREDSDDQLEHRQP